MSEDQSTDSPPSSPQPSDVPQQSAPVEPAPAPPSDFGTQDFQGSEPPKNFGEQTLTRGALPGDLQKMIREARSGRLTEPRAFPRPANPPCNRRQPRHLVGPAGRIQTRLFATAPDVHRNPVDKFGLFDPAGVFEQKFSVARLRSTVDAAHHDAAFVGESACETTAGSTVTKAPRSTRVSPLRTPSTVTTAPSWTTTLPACVPCMTT